MADYNKQRDYLIGKLIEGALVLYNLFDGIMNINNRTRYKISKSMEIYEKLLSHHHLTYNQKRYLEGIVSRVSKAIKVVEYLKDKYTITNPHPPPKKIINNRELYRAVYEKEPQRGFTSKFYNFAIGFYIDDKSLFRKGEYGHMAGIWWGAMGQFLDQIEREMKNEKIKHKDLDALCFRINHRALYDPISKIEDLNRPSSVAKHELKHIVDKLIDSNDKPPTLENKPLTKELSADLFIRKINVAALNRECQELEKRIEEFQSRYETLKEEGAPEFLLDGELELIRGYEKVIQQIKDIPIDTIKRICQKGLEPEVISYIVCMTPINKLKRRLEMVDEYLGRCPISQKTSPISSAL